jgi:putative NADPH-quinone reductase
MPGASSQRRRPIAGTLLAQEKDGMSTKVVAIVGGYRKGGNTDQAVAAILEGARARGAETRSFYLREEPIEFCTNCRTCMQAPGETRGKCKQQDGIETILAAVEEADAVVLASPVNCWNATALFRRFLERLVGYAYWPWGQKAPRLRSKRRPRQAVLVASSAMPGFLIPLATGAARALRGAAQMLGARPVGSLWIGLAAQEPTPKLPGRVRERATRLGAKLAPTAIH